MTDPVKPYNSADPGPPPNVDLKDVINTFLNLSRKTNLN